MEKLYLKSVKVLIVQAAVLFDIYDGMEIRIARGEISDGQLQACCTNIEMIRDYLNNLYEDDNFMQSIADFNEDLAQDLILLRNNFSEIKQGLLKEYEEINSVLKISSKNPENVKNVVFDEVKKFKCIMPWEIKNIKE